MKEIICQDESCKYNYLNHCLEPNGKNLLKIDKNHECLWYSKNPRYNESIKETLSVESNEVMNND